MDWNNADDVFNLITRDGNSWTLFDYASNELKDNKELVLKLVDPHYYILQLVSRRLLDDYDVILKAVMVNGIAIQAATYRLLLNKRIVLEAINSFPKGYTLYYYIPDEIYNDEQIQLAIKSKEYLNLMLEIYRGSDEIL